MISVTPVQLMEIGSILQQVGRMIERTVPTGLVAEGQCNEFSILRKLLPENEGVYIDIGAGDPESCSNTWAFYQAGWHGLLIEPYPGFWFKLMRLRPRDHLSPFACSNVDGFARMRVCGTCNSLRPDWNIDEQSTILVETAKLSTILLAYPELRDNCKLCSIDVEGLESEVLEGVDWETFHPEVFCVEYLRFNPSGPKENLSVEWEHILLNYGYVRHAQTALNYIYITTAIANRLAAKKEAAEKRVEKQSKEDQLAAEELERLKAKIEAERLAKVFQPRFQNGQPVE